MKKEWFASWFDSPYYHTLYKNHDENEAKVAIDNLLRAISLPAGARVLDLACGKGRHSRYLADKGFEVVGLDISFASIMFARQFETEQLSFYQHDMRLPFRINYFDAVVNFFTSFGYFETDREHVAALQNVAKNLKPGGVLVIDFFNAQFVKDNLVHEQTKTEDNIAFHLKKSVRKGYVYKTVEFETGGKSFYFREKVRLFGLNDFEQMFQAAGLRLVQAYGSYDLAPFELKTSKRLILLAEKPAL